MSSKTSTVTGLARWIDTGEDPQWWKYSAASIVAEQALEEATQSRPVQAGFARWIDTGEDPQWWKYSAASIVAEQAAEGNSDVENN